MKSLRFLAAALLLAAPAALLAVDITVDFDEKADFTRIKTFDFKVQENPKNPLLVQRVMEGVEARLKTDGVTRSTENPDVYVVLYGTTREEVRVDTTYWGYSPGPYWRGYGYGAPTMASTNVYQYEIGTLVIDIYDAKSKSLLWRGTGSDTVVDNPEKMKKKVDKALDKLFAKYPPVK